MRERQLLEHQLEAARSQEHAARHAVFHDPLTALANRVLFNDRLEQGLAQAKWHGWTIAVVYRAKRDRSGFAFSANHDVPQVA